MESKLGQLSLNAQSNYFVHLLDFLWSEAMQERNQDVLLNRFVFWVWFLQWPSSANDPNKSHNAKTLKITKTIKKKKRIEKSNIALFLNQNKTLETKKH